MRLLANENFPGAAVTALRNAGHDVLWVRTESPGATDRAVLHAAQAQERILLTFDKDFGELAFRSNLPAQSGIILFRLAPASPDRVSEIAVAALRSPIQWQGYFSTVEEERIRTKPLPVQSTPERS